MPVMTSACGTGSPPSSGGRAPAGHDAEYQERAGAEKIERQDLAQRLGIGDQAEQAEPGQNRAANPEQRGGIHWRRIRCGVPNAKRPSVTPIDRVSATSTTMINGLAYPAG